MKGTLTNAIHTVSGGHPSQVDSVTYSTGVGEEKLLLPLANVFLESRDGIIGELVLHVLKH